MDMSIKHFLQHEIGSQLNLFQHISKLPLHNPLK